MAVWRFAVSDSPGILDSITHGDYGAEGRQLQISAQHDHRGNGHSDVEIPGEYPELSGFGFHVGQDGAPVQINVQGAGSQKQEPQIDVQFTPLGFGQPPKPPVGPEG